MIKGHHYQNAYVTRDIETSVASPDNARRSIASCATTGRCRPACRRRLHFHHACMRVPDWGAFRARVETQPYPVVFEGGGDALRFPYLDTLGHYLEYTWMTDARWRQMGGRQIA